MDSLYGDAHRALQDDFGTTKLAEFLDKHHVHRAIDEQDRAFIESRDMFFLSTVDEGGNPTVSYKGGPTGVVTVVGDKELAFPGYDGNGMFLSMGNIAGQGKVGMLFIDFETPHRLRVQGTAQILRDDPLKDSYPEAQYIVRVAVETVWVNCPRYIHRYTKVDQSRYVPKAGAETPLAQWKRLDFVQPVIADKDRARVAEEGELDLGAYGELIARGQG
ncbi:pyridoxamine 5'-phosphate oxidase family protein [Methylobacterium komagatae]|uniref:Pyridoxamine 5'-phosphate oxidase family protein n=1 Tax=Methylobacterium komagatae TaxID=374425 RepID=A0ABW2BDS1_9HYPH